ncbi:immunoglobulin-like domain-containing protein [Solirubrobacter soli]|uniref:immunoglobulin-like domain-containing protein n=1 Tax=Solirubrobacter soli TaxID=363832 RepID=UPI000406DEC1|nr:immunoglobulin-like domain-containing protein [Solirubrobacter soli]
MLPLILAAAAIVTFPKADVVNPGTRVTVRIASDQPVKATLVRVTTAGTVMRTIKRKTLRTGTFTVRIPAGRHALRVSAGRRHWQHRIDGVWTDCVQATAKTTALTLKAATVQRGGTLPYDFENTGKDCSFTGLSYRLERQAADGTWAAVPLPWVFPAVAFAVAPGGTRAKTARIPADVEPGRFRLIDGVAAEFDVTA